MLELPLIELSRRLRAREISATELVDEALRRIDEYRDLPVFLSVNELARADAARLDRRGAARSYRWRPLEGIPIGVKDNMAVRGLRTSCGSRFYADRVGIEPPSKRDATLVARWRAAGAIMVGKTHLNEFAYGLTGENASFGDLTQPRHPALLTGGSSSGAAAAVQAGMAAVGLGTDTGGSIRVPAALCGLVGLRLTRDARANRGIFPLAPTFDTGGWLHRHLADAPFLHRALAGSPSPRSPRRPLRIGFLRGRWLEICEPEILAEGVRLRHWLVRRGWKVADEAVDHFAHAAEIFSPLQAAEAARVHRDNLLDPVCGYEPPVRARLEAGQALTLAQKRELNRRRRALCEELRVLWQRHDLLLAPATPVRELRRGEDHAAHRAALLQLTTPFSLGGGPVLVFPWGAPPAPGWQLAAPPDGENLLMRFAETFTESV